MRSSPRSIVIRLLQAATGIVAVTLLWSTAGHRLDGWLEWLADIAFWTYVALRPLSIPLAWWTTTWEVDDRGVRFRSGWWAREETTVGWDEIVSVDVSQPYLHRLFGCYAVRFGLGTTLKQALRIDAVSAVTRDRIVAVTRLAQLSVDTPAGPSPAPVPVQAPRAPGSDRAGNEIYRIRSADYLLISVTYGQFILFVPAVMSVFDQVNAWVPLPLPDPRLVVSWSPLHLVGVALAVGAVSVAYGWLVAWLRYRGFQVRRHGTGYVTSGGLLSSETRTVNAHQITGLKITQNPLMRAFGYGRVSVLTTDAGDQPMANLLFPIIRLTSLSEALGDALPVPTAMAAGSLRLSRPAGLSLVVGGVVSWAGLMALAYTLRPDWIVAAATVITVGVALLVNSRWVVATTVPGQHRCSARRGVFWVSHLEFDSSVIQVVESRQGLVGRLSRTWSVALHYYDGRVRCIRAIGCSPSRRAALTESMLS